MSGEDCLSDMAELGETHDGDSEMVDEESEGSQEAEIGLSTPIRKFRPLGDHSSGTKRYGAAYVANHQQHSHFKDVCSRHMSHITFYYWS